MDMKTFLVVSTPNWSHIMIFWIFVAILLHVCTSISEDVKYKDVEDVIKRLEQLSRSRKSHQLSGDGPTFTRWGRSDCPPTSELVYSGYMAGPKYNVGGSGSNYLCLPKTPEWGDYTNYAEGKRGVIAGVELETQAAPYPEYLNNQDAACSVCQTVNHKSVLMIPALLSCPYGWNMEYNGYLVSQISQQGRGRSEYVCFDGSPVGVPGGEVNNNEALIYPVEVRCGSIKCSEYVSNRELTCVVCSR